LLEFGLGVLRELDGNFGAASDTEYTDGFLSLSAYAA